MITKLLFFLILSVLILGCAINENKEGSSGGDYLSHISEKASVNLPEEPNESVEEASGNFSQKINTPITGKAISDMDLLACTTAEESGTCFTKLPELGLISPGECCEKIGKCCKG